MIGQFLSSVLEITRLLLSPGLHYVMYWEHIDYWTNCKLVAKCWRAEFLFCHFLPQNAIDFGRVISFSHIKLSGRAGNQPLLYCLILYHFYTISKWYSFTLYIICFSQGMSHLVKCLSMELVFYGHCFISLELAKNHIKEHLIAHCSWLQGITAHFIVAVCVTPVCGQVTADSSAHLASFGNSLTLRSWTC